MTQDELDQFLSSAFPADPDAARFLADVTRLVRIVDDIADGDEADPHGGMAKIMEFTLLRFPTNPFYQRWVSALAPLLVSLHVVWAETEHTKTHPSEQRRMWGYIWRDGIELMLYHVAVLVGGVDLARIVLKAFVELEHGVDTESFADWESS